MVKYVCFWLYDEGVKRYGLMVYTCLCWIPFNLQEGKMKARWSVMEREGENADERGVLEGSNGLYHEL